MLGAETEVRYSRECSCVQWSVAWCGNGKKAEIFSVGYLHFVYQCQVGNVGAIPSFWKGRRRKTAE